jgi:hypothetical protein
MQVLALVWGILALIGMIVAFFPCLGSLNWLNIPFAAVGLIIGIIALASARTNDSGAAKVGVVCCAIAVLIGTLRLALGAGIF